MKKFLYNLRFINPFLLFKRLCEIVKALGAGHHYKLIKSTISRAQRNIKMRLSDKLSIGSMPGMPAKLEVRIQFLFPLVFKQFELPAQSEELVQILSNIFNLCLLIIFSFLNLLKDLYILYLIHKYQNIKNFEEKYSIF